MLVMAVLGEAADVERVVCKGRADDKGLRIGRPFQVGADRS